MEKFVVAGLADGAYGQTTDGFGNTEQSFENFFESIEHALKEDSNAMVQLESPVPQATLVASTSMLNQDRAIKRARDQAYRERVKKRKIEMEGNTVALTQKNKVLEDENTRLNKAFQSQKEEMDKLKHELNRLMPEYKKQDVLVKILSEQLAGSDLSLRDGEIQKLKNEIDLLRQGMGEDNLSLQLIEENAKLNHELLKVNHENRQLKMQLGAVCEKFIAETVGN
ncbi:hypothetical protein SLA2020_166890 [Shorea laevis]